MKIIAGLGNPGSEFEQTRHNIGFEVIDSIAESEGLSVSKSKYNALYGKGKIGNEEIILVKPLTYMNLSGEAIAPLMRFFKISIENLLVIYDDLDLPVGKMRLRLSGSAGGHNGMKSIIQHLGSNDFKRLRIGIGRPEGHQPVIDYVLKRFTVDQKTEIDDIINRATKACQSWCVEPFNNVMNQYNQ